MVTQISNGGDIVYQSGESKIKKMDWYQDIKDFHKEVMGDNFFQHPHLPLPELKELRKQLILEEVNETLKAMDENDLVEIADGIADSIVVLLGTAVTYGIDLRPVWDEVHRTNMAKKDGPIRADGKKLKPEGWKPPDIKKILDKQITFI
jgi:predicted HAD superfamily Cof-like phosphohydrolase